MTTNDLLSEIKKILIKSETKINESYSRGEQFNIFKVCGVNHYENTHSAILAELLNPNGTHGQKDLYLKLFIDIICPNFTAFKTSNATCQTEFTIPSGRRIDILIRDNENRLLVIENKIYATDQCGQITDYAKYASEQTNDFRFIYLTLNGEEASEESSGSTKYIKASYKEDIILWLNKCINKSAKMPIIRETLVQYQNHLKQLTNQNMETKERDELVSLMLKNSASIDAFMQVQNEYRTAVITKVKQDLKHFAENNSLEFNFSVEELLGNGKEKGFYFRKREWSKYAIWIYCEHREPYDFYIGISNYNGEISEEEFKKVQNKLDCFGGSASRGWPWGYTFLEEPYRNWWIGNGCFPAMINGDFTKYISEYVLKIINELKIKNIQLE